MLLSASKNVSDLFISPNYFLVSFFLYQNSVLARKRIITNTATKITAPQSSLFIDEMPSNKSSLLMDEMLSDITGK
jgi:hypothetical protein